MICFLWHRSVHSTRVVLFFKTMCPCYSAQCTPVSGAWRWGIWCRLTYVLVLLKRRIEIGTRHFCISHIWLRCRLSHLGPVRFWAATVWNHLIFCTGLEIFRAFPGQKCLTEQGLGTGAFRWYSSFKTEADALKMLRSVNGRCPGTSVP